MKPFLRRITIFLINDYREVPILQIILRIEYVAYLSLLDPSVVPDHVDVLVKVDLLFDFVGSIQILDRLEITLL
jgi:hypothetical protein